MNPFAQLINVETPNPGAVDTAGGLTSDTPDKGAILEFQNILNGDLSNKQLLTALVEPADGKRQDIPDCIASCFQPFNPITSPQLQLSGETIADNEIFLQAGSAELLEMGETMQFDGPMLGITDDAAGDILKSLQEVLKSHHADGKSSQPAHPAQKAGNSGTFLTMPFDLINQDLIEQGFNMPHNIKGEAENTADAVNFAARTAYQVPLKGGEVNTAGIVFDAEGKLDKRERDSISDDIISRVEKLLNVREVRLSSKGQAARSDAPDASILAVEEKPVDANSMGRATVTERNIPENERHIFGKTELTKSEFDSFFDANLTGSSKADLSATSSAGAGKADMVQSGTETAPVRFILPDNLDQNRPGNNRTIFIKLEPEHLGTVRLTLSSQDGGITGRLVVESTIVQSVVESNLNSLLDHLAEKGIKLDAFQVSVGGGQIGKRFAHNKATMSTKRQTGGSGRSETIEKVNSASGNIPGTGLYIGTAGVNWLA